MGTVVRQVPKCNTLLSASLTVLFVLLRSPTSQRILTIQSYFAPSSNLKSNVLPLPYYYLPFNQYNCISSIDQPRRRIVSKYFISNRIIICLQFLANKFICRDKPELLPHSFSSSGGIAVIMTSSSNAYINFLIQPDEPSRVQNRSVVNRIKSNPSELVFDEQIENQLLLDPENVIGRLETLLQAFETTSESQPVADQIVKNLLMPIVHSSHDLGPSKITRLLVLALHVVLKCPNPNLRSLGKAVSETEDLLELLTSHKQGSEIMKGWVENQYSSICEFSVLQAFTHRLLTLCNNCTHDHGTRDLSEKWEKLLKLRELLQSLKEDFAKTRAENDKNKQKDQKVKFSHPPLTTKVSTEVTTTLASFDIQPRLTSERMVDTILQRLESETTSSILKSIIISFPCRLCHETLDGTRASKDQYLLKKEDKRLITPAFNPEIFGKRFGVWKVLLSSQAVKNVQSASRSGWFL